MSDEIRNQISKLSVSEKILLVEEIWDSIANEEKSFELTDTQKRTVIRRSEELQENPTIGRRWEEIRDEFLGKK
jgi:putative addiction module component (TIGR02574 family)